MTATDKRTRPRGYIENYQPRAATRTLLGQVGEVLDEYRDYWPLTIRQLFYRLVGLDLIAKLETVYGNLVDHVGNARRARWIPFDAIRDDGVHCYNLEQYADADAFRATMRNKARLYQRDALADQPIYIEVWCEAAGMLEQVSRITHRYSVQAYSSSGFNSLTSKKDVADRIVRFGKPATVLHLGDFDPSGEAIYRALTEDVQAFVAEDRQTYDVGVLFHRVALTADQVESYSLPTAPPKKRDGRSKSWKGETCQLEALSPVQIDTILTAWLDTIVDKSRLAVTRDAEKEERQDLMQMFLPAPS